MNKTMVVLKALKEGQKLTQLKATTEGVTVSLGGQKITEITIRLGAIIFVLREKGYPIITTLKGKSNYAEYHLEEDK